jgi:hypothetical protein
MLRSRDGDASRGRASNRTGARDDMSARNPVVRRNDYSSGFMRPFRAAHVTDEKILVRTPGKKDKPLR